MVSTFCSNHDHHCQDLPEVQDIVLRYESLLGSSCLATGQDEEDRMILSLKALRNIGFIKRGHAALQSCWTDFTNSMFYATSKKFLPHNFIQTGYGIGVNETKLDTH